MDGCIMIRVLRYGEINIKVKNKPCAFGAECAVRVSTDMQLGIHQVLA